ncbi:MAG: 4-alpha-glucanotransferase, partial [Microbacterium sp.]
MSSIPPSPELVALAEAHGIAAEYWSFYGERVSVDDETLRAVLRSMGVDPRSDADVTRLLAAVHDGPWRQLVPPSLVVRERGGELAIHVADGHDVHLAVELEDGGWRELAVPDQEPQTRLLDGVAYWAVRVPLPDDLPLGWHTVHARELPFGSDEPRRTATCVLVVTPDRIPDPPARPANRGRAWGLMAQLYSVRSRASWGMGDFADLADLAAIAGAQGADFLLINPVHAAEVTVPIEPSPYLPATRRFLAPLYVRPDDIREAAYLPAAGRALVERLREPVAAADTDPARIDRDAVWTAKRPALEAIFAVPRSAGREAELRAFARAGGQPLADFALWCALEEHYDGAERPAEADDIDSPLVAALREELADR